MDDITIRPLAVDERKAAADVVRAALLSQPTTDEFLQKRMATWDAADGLAAWDGDRCVGHAAAFRFDTTVPGGARVPTAGVTRVGVLPTHTRRGLLRALMERLLRDAHGRGQVLATLLASEATIYERFGFGLASDDEAVAVDAGAARPMRDTPAGGSMRILDRDELFDTIPPLHDRCGRWRSGAIGRERWMWEVELEDVAEPTSERFARAVVAAVHTDEHGVDDGFVIYEVGWDDRPEGNPSASGKVREMFAVDAAAERALWDHLLHVDLVRTWTSESRPAGDPIRRAFRDLRAYETRRRLDETWARALDLDAALRARTYGQGSGEVVVEVEDPLFAHNCGRWRISAEGAVRTDGAADIAADIAAISAAYFGGVAWTDLAASGEIAGTFDRTVLAELDALFLVHPGPFCGTHY